MPLGHQQYEMAIPIGSLPEELNCSPSDTVGMIVGVTDTTETSSETGGWWVQSIAPANWNNPSVYGKLILSMEVGVEESGPFSRGSVRTDFLSQNSPNPFKGATEIRFGVAKHCRVSIDVFDVTGRRVKNLVSQDVAAGTHSVSWDGKGRDGVVVPSGTYFLRMTGGGASLTKRMIALK
jgi:hypothetical protein